MAKIIDQNWQANEAFQSASHPILHPISRPTPATAKTILYINPTPVDIDCYDFSPTHVEHTFSFLLCDNLTLAATCTDGSYFISILLLT